MSALEVVSGVPRGYEWLRAKGGIDLLFDLLGSSETLDAAAASSAVAVLRRLVVTL